jgi:hypothetical protein
MRDVAWLPFDKAALDKRIDNIFVRLPWNAND